MRKMIFCLGLITCAFAHEHKDESLLMAGYDTSSEISMQQKTGSATKRATTPAKIQKSPNNTSDLYWSFPEGTAIEARFSCFIPQSSLLRDIYHYCGVNYELEGTIPIWKPLQIWWAFDYFNKHGTSQGLHNATKIQLFPITLGLKALFRTRWVQPYFGLGMRYFFVWTHNHSSYVHESLFKNGMGGAAEFGVLIQPIRHFVIDLFTTYSYKSFHTKFSSTSNLSGQTLNVGGWQFGDGFGYQF